MDGLLYVPSSTVVPPAEIKKKAYNSGQADNTIINIPARFWPARHTGDRDYTIKKM